MTEQKSEQQQPHPQGQQQVIVTGTPVGPGGKPAKSNWRPKDPRDDSLDLSTAKPKDETDGGQTVPTSAGELDYDTVVHNRVGGVGVVHMHNDPQSPVGGALLSQQGVAFPQGVKDDEFGKPPASTPPHATNTTKR